MAEKRMFAKRITEMDSFLDMPCSSQMLYFHLSMNADDDGFVNNPKKIQRMCGASDDDLKILLLKMFVISFESGIIVIRHWKMHNYIQKDRYRPTDYIEEKSQLGLEYNKSYTLDETKMIERCVALPDKRTYFKPPTLKEVSEYCEERNNGIDPQAFVDFYESKGWVVGKSKMKDWKASIRTWERNKNGGNTNGRTGRNDRPAEPDVYAENLYQAVE